MPLYKQLTDRIDAIPGIRSSSVATCALAQGCLDASDVRIVGKSGSKKPTVTVQENSVSLDYFKTVGVQLLQGRDFATTDNATAPKIAVVNQTFARRFLKGGNAVGRRFSYTDNNPDSFVIVGLVTDARVNDVREIAPPLIYFPIAQRAQDIHSIDIRTTADPQWVAKQVRQAITEVDHRLPIIEINTLSEQVDRNLTQQRLIARLTTMFGMLALGLSCLGLYGVMSYTVQLRTNEIGIRLALGSPRSTVLWLILKETLLVISAGAIVGLAFSIMSMHLAMGFLFGLSPEDPATIAIAGGLLFLVSIGAGLAPAWRATNISPTEALRFE
jgi:predicted permease